MTRPPVNAGAKHILLTCDKQHSVLRSLDTDPAQQASYTAYGYHRAPIDQSSLLGFNGEPTQPLNGHYALGHGYRLFMPVLMRFNRPDRLSPFGAGGLNAYAYCLADPINRRDPSGHMWLGDPVVRLLKQTRPMGRAPGIAKRTQVAQTFLGDLPNEMIEQILKHTPAKDIQSFTATSKRMNEVVTGYRNRQNAIYTTFIASAQTPQDQYINRALAATDSVPNLRKRPFSTTGHTREGVMEEINRLNRHEQELSVRATRVRNNDAIMAAAAQDEEEALRAIQMRVALTGDIF